MEQHTNVIRTAPGLSRCAGATGSAALVVSAVIGGGGGGDGN